jgi:hypothetical protein
VVATVILAAVWAVPPSSTPPASAVDTPLVTITPASVNALYGQPLPDLSVPAWVEGWPDLSDAIDSFECTAQGLAIRDGRINSPAGTYPLTCALSSSIFGGVRVTFRPATLTVRPATATFEAWGLPDPFFSGATFTVDIGVGLEIPPGLDITSWLDRLDAALIFTPVNGPCRPGRCQPAGPEVRVPFGRGEVRPGERSAAGGQVVRFAPRVDLDPGSYEVFIVWGGNDYWRSMRFRVLSLIDVTAPTSADITPASPTGRYGMPVPDLSVVADVDGIPADDPQLDTLDCTAEGLAIRSGNIDSPAGSYPLNCTVDDVEGRTVTFQPANLTVEPGLVHTRGTGRQLLADGQVDELVDGALPLFVFADGKIELNVFLLDSAVFVVAEPTGDLSLMRVRITAEPAGGGPAVTTELTPTPNPEVKGGGVLAVELDLAPGTWNLYGETIDNGYWTDEDLPTDGGSRWLVWENLLVFAPPTTAPTTTTTTTVPETTTTVDDVAPPTSTPPAPAVAGVAVTAAAAPTAAPPTTATPTGLALTGGDVGLLSTVAAVLMLAGGLLLFARRRHLHRP